MPLRLPHIFSRVFGALQRRRAGAHRIAAMPIDAAWRTEFGDADQFLVSFPRSGNTWLRHLLRELIVMQRPDLAPPEQILALLPTVHHKVAVEPRHAEFGLTTRLFKSHNIADLAGRRMAYLFREPADAVVSFYHHHQRRAAMGKVPALTEPLDVFCRQLLPDWCEHLELAIKQRRAFPDRTHFAAYESLQRETAGTLRGIVDFLELAGTDAQIAEAVERCSFARLQTREQEHRGPAPANPFFRKGRIGGGAEELQPETRAAIQRAGEPLYRAACALAAEAPARP